MSSGTCNTAIDGTKCHRPSGHPGDHMTAVTEKAPTDLCQTPNPGSVLLCTQRRGHVGGHQTRDGDGVLHTWHGTPAEPSIPHSVRARVELHRAQTEFDLTVLKNRIDCLPTVTNVSKELRRKREQITAELDAWTYLAGVTKRPE